MLIRDFMPGEEEKLRQVFMSSVHELARGFYTQEQLDAWAPDEYDEQKWADSISSLRPFIAIVDTCVAGYADLQASGYIDHFFVAGQFSERGIGSALMDHIGQMATTRKIAKLSAHVSLAAESFFAKHGFSVERRQFVVINGVAMSNALMVRQLSDHDAYRRAQLHDPA